MSKLGEAREIQRSLIKDLKLKGYEYINSLPENKEYELPEKFDHFEMNVKKNKNGDGSLSIAVELIDSSEPLAEEILGVELPENISIVNSSYEDGFDIYEDGKILDMHSLR